MVSLCVLCLYEARLQYMLWRSSGVTDVERLLRRACAAESASSVHHLADAADALCHCSESEALDTIKLVLINHNRSNHLSTPVEPVTSKAATPMPKDTARSLASVVARISPDRHTERHAAIGKALFTVLVDDDYPSEARLNAAQVVGELFRIKYFDGDPYVAMYELFSRMEGGISTATAASVVQTVLDMCERPKNVFFMLRLHELQQRSAITPKTSATHASVALPAEAPPEAPRDIQKSTGHFENENQERENQRNSAAREDPALECNTTSDEMVPLPPREERFERITAEREGSKECTVYVNKIDPTITESQLRDLLDSCGRVLRVRLCGDTVGRTKYGFVEYTAPEEAQLLLAKDRVVLGNTIIRCLPARQPILDNDPLMDAQFDPRKGFTRACLFGIISRGSFKEKKNSGSGKE